MFISNRNVHKKYRERKINQKSRKHLDMYTDIKSGNNYSPFKDQMCEGNDVATTLPIPSGCIWLLSS